MGLNVRLIKSIRIITAKYAVHQPVVTDANITAAPTTNFGCIRSWICEKLDHTRENNEQDGVSEQAIIETSTIWTIYDGHICDDILSGCTDSTWMVELEKWQHSERIKEDK